MRVLGNECIGKEITRDIENPTRGELDIEDSTHELYCQSSCFNECLYTSGIQHLLSENTTVRPSEDGDINQHGDHACHKKSSKQFLELQPTKARFA